MLRTYITSPLRADSPAEAQRNVAYAKLAKLDSLVRHGETPYAPHIDLGLILRDTVPSHRALGMRAGKAMMSGMQQNAVYRDLGFSDGMREDIDLAIALNIPLVERSLFERKPSFAQILAMVDALELEISRRAEGCE